MASEGYVVIRDALRKTGKIGLAQLTITGREWLVAIAPLEDGLVMEMLRYSDELRAPSDYFDEIPSAKPDKEMIELAVQLITKKAEPFEPDKYQDHYQSALKQLIRDKVKGHKIVAAPDDARPTGANVVDLMDALKKSLGHGGASTGKSPNKPKASRSKKSA